MATITTESPVFGVKVEAMPESKDVSTPCGGTTNAYTTTVEKIAEYKKITAEEAQAAVATLPASIEGMGFYDAIYLTQTINRGQGKAIFTAAGMSEQELFAFVIREW